MAAITNAGMQPGVDMPVVGMDLNPENVRRSRTASFSSTSAATGCRAASRS
jgi:ABC-type sugar transport system substrate-binding protein